ncbi:MAG: cytochrome c oxidase accessory protein CcoG [Ghiorsea sp.]
MSDSHDQQQTRVQESSYEINTGGPTVHARRVKGRFRNIKTLVMTLIYLPLFILPYISWGDRPAVLWDIPNRKFYFFDMVVWPQDLLVLAIILLFCFMLLFAMTVIAGRIFCGFVCPQTIWVDVMTWIENKVEGGPAKRIKLDNSPWNANKIIRRGGKHILFLAFCIFTAIHVVAYFSGIWDLYGGLATFNLRGAEWITLGAIIITCYVSTSLMREQFCMWICPYARIQAVCADKNTQLIAYDHNRGEQRGKMKKGEIVEGNGDCIDCNLCVVTCPTGVDIRQGQQIGCINCGICADACNSVMRKISLPEGLIRFASTHEIDENVKVERPFLKLRPIFYGVITFLSLVAIVYSLANKSELELYVSHQRAPQYTLMSDGSIQNRYHLDILNKTESPTDLTMTITGIKTLTSNSDGHVFHLKSSEIKKYVLQARVPAKHLSQTIQPITITLQSTLNPEINAIYQTHFIGPNK